MPCTPPLTWKKYVEDENYQRQAGAGVGRIHARVARHVRKKIRLPILTRFNNIQSAALSVRCTLRLNGVWQ